MSKIYAYYKQKNNFDKKIIGNLKSRALALRQARSEGNDL